VGTRRVTRGWLALAAAVELTAMAGAQQLPPAEIPFDGGDAGTEYFKHYARGGSPEQAPPYHIGPDGGYSVLARGGERWMEWVCWLAAERERDAWDWAFYLRDRVTCHSHDIGLEALLQPQWPPFWYWESPECVPFECLEHGQKSFFLSIWAPSTIQSYERFFRAAAAAFAQRRHKFDAIRVPITGDFGEGNYPLGIWDVRPGTHCHPGWWCGDRYAREDFRSDMLAKYGGLEALNRAWGTTFTATEQVCYPQDQHAVRYWLDFVEWYQDSLTEFADKSISLCRRVFPDHTLFCALGGGWPSLYWGEDPSGLAKVAAKYGVIANPAAMSGNAFYSMAFVSPYNFYGVPISTEAAGKLSAEEVFNRIFIDLSSPIVRYYDYGENYGRGAPYLERYAPLFGTCGDPVREVAVFVPTTTAYLKVPAGLSGLAATADGANLLRDVTDFSVLDERMIADGALERAKVLIVFELQWIERSTVEKIADWLNRGGLLIAPRFDQPVLTPEGDTAAWAQLVPEPGPLGAEEPTLPLLLQQCAKKLGTGGTFTIPPPHSQGRAYVTAARNILYGYPQFMRGLQPPALVDPDFDGVLATVMTHRVLLQNRTQRDVTKMLARSAPGLSDLGPWVSDALSRPTVVPATTIVALGPGTPPRLGPLRRTQGVAPGVPQQSPDLPRDRLGDSLLPEGFALDAGHLEGLPDGAPLADGMPLDGQWVTIRGFSGSDYLLSCCFRCDAPDSRPELRIRYRDERTYYSVFFDAPKHWAHLTWATEGQRHTIAHVWAYWFGGHWYHLALGACGSEIVCYLNGIELGRVQHSAIADGGVQIGTWDGKVTFRDLEVREWRPGKAAE